MRREKAVCHLKLIGGSHEVLKFNTELYPSFAFSYVHLANIYERMGNVAEAIASYNQAIKLNPGDERIKRQLERLESKK